MSNAIMSQVALGAERGETGIPPGGNLGPDLPEGAKNEDLFVFTARHVTMKKGERVVAPIAEYTVPYTDVFALDLPYAPPPELRSNLNTEQESEMARLLGAPLVAHKVRLTNKGIYPLTTAPALVLRDNRVLAQGTMTYTAIAKAEIYHGLRRGEEAAAERFFSACRCLVIDEEVGEQAGRYLSAYRRSHGVELADALVAASARIHKAALYTLNRRHFPMKDIRFFD